MRYSAAMTDPEASPILAALDRINALLDSPDESTVATSMRFPANLRDAAALAVEHLGLASSTTQLAAAGLRQVLEATVNTAVLEEHFRQYPEDRPTLAEVAQALAALDGHPLADRPDLIAQAAEAVVQLHPAADGDDVLLFAEGRYLASTSTGPGRTAKTTTKATRVPAKARRSA